MFNVRSSNAGASSSAFHVYRQARAREITRIGALEEDDRKQKEREETESRPRPDGEDRKEERKRREILSGHFTLRLLW